MQWLVNQLTDLLNGSSVRFFLREMQDASGTMRLAKFKNKLGWNIRCVVWPTTGGCLFIHVPKASTTRLGRFFEYA